MKFAKKMTLNFKTMQSYFLNSVITFGLWIFFVEGSFAQQRHQALVDSVACYICASNIQHKNVVMKQAILESGWCSSEFLMKRNNLFGFRAKKYLHFETWQESIDYYEKWQKKRYTDNNEDYFKFLDRIRYGAPGYSAKVKKIRYELNCPCLK